MSAEAPASHAAAIQRDADQETDRAHWPLLTLSSLLIFLALGYLWLQLSTPFDGSHLRPGTEAITAEGLVVTPVREQPSNLQEGDLVTAIEGQSLESWAQALFSFDVQRPKWHMGDTIRYTVIRDGRIVDVPVTLGPYPLAAIVSRTWGTIFFAFVFLVVAAFVYARRPQLEATRVLFLGAASLVAATTWSLGAQVGDFVNGSGFWLFQLTTVPAFMLYWTTLCHFALVFPRPLAMTKRTWLLPLLYGAPYLLLSLYLGLSRRAVDSTLTWLAGWGVSANVHAAFFLALALAVIVQQYRTHYSGVARQQILWVVLAALLAGTAGLAFYFLPPLFGAQALHPNYIGFIVTVFPVSIAIAVLRYNLFDIDTLINRTLVYGALTAAVIALYVLVVTALGAVFQARGDLFVSLVATGLAAVLFQPLRARLQGVVNRLMYGERDDPQTVLTQLGKRLGASLTTDAVLPTLVETVAQVLKLPYVGLAFMDSGSTQTVASYGRSRHPPVVFPLSYQGETVGELRLEPRASDEPFSSSELALMEVVAQQAGVAVYAVRVTADLLKSRERLVSTREEERRRLRRDLHDGIGPALAGMTLKLDAAHNLLKQNPPAVEPMLVGLREQIQSLVGDLRHLVHALRPAALDLGLLVALREQVRHYEQEGLEIALRASEPLPPLPAAVEVAAYRIVQEALTNVVRHANANSCQVSLRATTQLEITVIDDGVGLPAARRAGVGLGSMRERAIELGGQFTVSSNPNSGTRVVVQLPLRETRV